jgi:hypothetical protein
MRLLSARQRSGKAFTEPQSQLQAFTPKVLEARRPMERQHAVQGALGNEEQQQANDGPPNDQG